MAGIPIRFPPSSPMPKLESLATPRPSRVPPHPAHHSSANGVHKRRKIPDMPFRPKGSVARLPPNEQIKQLRQSRKEIKGKLYSRIARLQRELDVSQQEHQVDQDTPPILASRFWPTEHDAKPRDLFSHDVPPQRGDYYSRAAQRPPPRMTRLAAPHDEILIYTSASCLNQHTSTEPRSAASAFVFAPPGSAPRSIAFRLERKGPSGEEHPQEANRAHLRAAIAALLHRQWRNEGWITATLASDSEYLVEGITNWVEIWQQNGWRTSRDTGNSYEGGRVANRDLWEMLLRLIASHQEMGVEIKFWLILHELNAEAHAEARTAAEKLKEEEDFCRLPHGEETRSLHPAEPPGEHTFFTRFAAGFPSQD